MMVVTNKHDGGLRTDAERERERNRDVEPSDYLAARSYNRIRCNCVSYAIVHVRIVIRKYRIHCVCVHGGTETRHPGSRTRARDRAGERTRHKVAVAVVPRRKAIFLRFCFSRIEIVFVPFFFFVCFKVSVLFVFTRVYVGGDKSQFAPVDTQRRFERTVEKYTALPKKKKKVAAGV